MGLCKSNHLRASEDSLYGLQKNYLFVTSHKNYPLGKTEGFLITSGYSYGVRFFHSLSDKWVMSVAGNFKNFNDKIEGGRRSVATLSHETLSLMRMYYPAYFLFGVRTMYLLPSLSNSIPPKRDPALDAEVGIGISAYIFTRIFKDYSLFFRTGRWRGTKTTRLQAYDVSLGFGKSFYSAYHEILPEQEGYATRKQIYNLYHLMNHANLFGGSYTHSVRDVLSQYSN